jgi:hypothetical protein
MAGRDFLSCVSVCSTRCSLLIALMDRANLHGVSISKPAFCTLSLLKHKIGNQFVREE